MIDYLYVCIMRDESFKSRDTSFLHVKIEGTLVRSQTDRQQAAEWDVGWKRKARVCLVIPIFWYVWGAEGEGTY